MRYFKICSEGDAMNGMAWKILFSGFFGVVLFLSSPICTAAASFEVTTLLGKTVYIPDSGDTVDVGSCVFGQDIEPVVVGDQSYDDLGVVSVKCGKQDVIALAEAVSKTAGGVGWIVRDVLLVAPLKKGDDVSHSYREHWCALRGAASKSMSVQVVRVHRGKHKRMDYRSGVIAAWGADVRAKKFVPLNVRQIVCEEPDDYQG